MIDFISIRKEFGLIIIGAIIFTASFLWKDLLTDIEEMYFPRQYGISGRIIYTTLITILLVMLAVHLKGRLGLTSSDKSKIEFDDSPLDNDDMIKSAIGIDNNNENFNNINNFGYL